jgi:hypothetical protein
MPEGLALLGKSPNVSAVCAAQSETLEFNARFRGK